MAAHSGHANCVEALLKGGANPEATNSDGLTALIHAAEEGHADCVEALLQAGANLEATNNNGFTALLKPLRLRVSGLDYRIRGVRDGLKGFDRLPADKQRRAAQAKRNPPPAEENQHLKKSPTKKTNSRPPLTKKKLYLQKDNLLFLKSQKINK